MTRSEETQLLTLGPRSVALAWCALEHASLAQLTPVEQTLARRGKTPKRRDEFCAGRIAAHAAVTALEPRASTFEVVALTDGDEAGRPVLEPSLGIALSISHSTGWAVAAAAHGGPLGVDIESLALSVEPSFADDAFMPEELERWRTFNAPNALAIAWAAKEAGLKFLGVGLRMPLLQFRVAPVAVTQRAADQWVMRVALERSTAPRIELDGALLLTKGFALVAIG